MILQLTSFKNSMLSIHSSCFCVHAYDMCTIERIELNWAVIFGSICQIILLRFLIHRHLYFVELYCCAQVISNSLKPKLSCRISKCSQKKFHQSKKYTCKYFVEIASIDNFYSTEKINGKPMFTHDDTICHDKFLPA